MTALPRALPRLLRALEAAGCDPWLAGDGHWYARCPSCALQGHAGIVEIRASELGIIVCCSTAHEPPRRRAA